MYEVLVSVRLYVNHGFVASKLMRFLRKLVTLRLFYEV